MSSSTVTKPYITESWIHMQQHGLYDKSTTEKEGVNSGRGGGVAGGKYARSTASSRSRALNTADSGMSQSGIYEAFAEADRYDAKKSMHTKKYMDTRRKSTTQVEMNRRTSVASSTASPRLNTINTKKSSDSIASTKKPTSTLIQGRRQTLSGALSSAKSNVNNNNSSSSSSGNGGGLIRLADTLRDTLAVERRLAQQELGLLNNEKKATTTTTRVQQQQKQILNSEQNVVDMITSAKRRSSMTKEKLRSLEQPTRRRTLSSGATLLTPHQQPPQRPKLTPPGTAPTNDAGGASYMKPTLADQQRRHSLANSPLSTTSTRNSSSPRRRKSNAIQKGAESPSFTTSEDDRESSSPTHHSNPVSALKRRSILAAATAKARQLHQKQQQQCPDLVVDAEETITSSTAAAAAAGGGTTSSGDEKPTAISKVMRTRKKSLGLDTDALYSRRMSRTESLKEGLPTSPSMMAARMSRRKSVVNQESPINPAPPNKRWSKENGNTTGDEQPQTLKKTVRKRGKVNIYMATGISLYVY